jgi:hypothetical protein
MEVWMYMGVSSHNNSSSASYDLAVYRVIRITEFKATSLSAKPSHVTISVVKLPAPTETIISYVIRQMHCRPASLLGTTGVCQQCVA